MQLLTGRQYLTMILRSNERLNRLGVLYTHQLDYPSNCFSISTRISFTTTTRPTSSLAEFSNRYPEVYPSHNDAYVQFAWVCVTESAGLRCTRRPPGNDVLDTTLRVGFADEFDSIAGDAYLCVL